MHEREMAAGGVLATGGTTDGPSVTEGGTVAVADPQERPMRDEGRQDVAQAQPWSTARGLEQLRGRHARLEQLLEIAHELARSQAREELLLQRIAERGAQLLTADAFAVLLLSGDRFVVHGAAGDASEVFGESGPPRARSAVATALHTGAAVVIPDVGGGRTAVTVPLRGAWHALGVLAATRPAVQPFEADDVEGLTTLSAHAGTALENARRYREVREADQRKDDFLARLAHELRNPLAPIVHALHLLDRVAGHGPQGVQLREIMARQTRHLGCLVDDLLDVSRIRLDKLSLRLQPLDLRDVARRSVEALQVSRHAEGHEISLAMAPEPVVVNGDPGRLEQVVGNLLQNAVKYTPRGAPIHVAVERTPREAVLRVHDRGIGIAPEMLPHIFQMFMQADRSLDRAQGGLGLGLALVRALVEHHGGSVTAESAGLGCGSQFTVRLPLSAARPAATDGGRARPQTRPTRILVVEDNPDARETLRAVLEMEGHRVAVAIDGADAVELGAAFRPEIAFIDIGLPGLDGFEVARRLRARDGDRRIMLIALTGRGQPEDRRQAQAAGFDGYLVKPVVPEQLFELIARVPPTAG
jgi:signal transduction histidine kinase/CheY-like chemotaxis protein